MSYTYEDESGNAGSITVGVGNATPVSEIDDPAVQDCDDFISRYSTPQLSLAVPLTVTAEVTSSLAANIGISFTNMEQAVGGGVQPIGSVLTYFADGDQQSCDQFGENSTIGSVSWTNLSPGTTGSWHGWYVVASAITPNDPTGAASLANRLVLQVPLGAHLTDRTNIITCSDSVAYMATNPTEAQHIGC